jgi:hypothetical protein
MFGRVARHKIKELLPESVINQVVRMERATHVMRAFWGRHKRDCPICGYHGFFYGSGGTPMIFDAVCP